MDSTTATVVFGCLQAVVLGIVGVVAKTHMSEMRVQSANQKRFADAVSELAKVVADLRDRLTIQQERFDAHDKATTHNFAQVRTALSSPPQCNFDETQTKDIHEAARSTLRTRPA